MAGPEFNTYTLPDGRQLKLPSTYTPEQVNESLDVFESMKPEPTPSGVGPFTTRNPFKIATETVKDLLSGSISGLPGGYKSPEAEAIGGKVAEFTVPQNLTEAALLGTQPLARGMGLGKAATGALLPAVGGAASLAQGSLEQGQFTPKAAIPGAVSGTVAGGLGALASAPGWFARATPPGKEKVLAGMAAEVTEAAGKHAPVVKGLGYTELAERPGKYLQPLFSQQFREGLSRAEALAPGASITSPRLVYLWKKLPKTSPEDLIQRTSLAPDPATMKFTVMQTEELLKLARKGAFTGSKLTTEKARNESARKLYDAARKEAYSSAPNGAGDVLENTRILHGVHMGMADIFKSGGAFKPSPRGPQFDPNAVLDYVEKNGDKLAQKIGEDALAGIKGALLRGAEAGARHDFGATEMVPGILERNIVIARSVLKHFGIRPMKLVGTRPQPFSAGIPLETMTGQLGAKGAGLVTRPMMTEE